MNKKKLDSMRENGRVHKSLQPSINERDESIEIGTCGFSSDVTKNDKNRRNNNNNANISAKMTPNAYKINTVINDKSATNDVYYANEKQLLNGSEANVNGEVELQSILNGVTVYVECERSCTATLVGQLTKLGAKVAPNLNKKSMATHMLFHRGREQRVVYVRTRRPQIHIVSALWVDRCYRMGRRMFEGDYPVNIENDNADDQKRGTSLEYSVTGSNSQRKSLGRAKRPTIEYLGIDAEIERSQKRIKANKRRRSALALKRTLRDFEFPPPDFPCAEDVVVPNLVEESTSEGNNESPARFEDIKKRLFSKCSSDDFADSPLIVRVQNNPKFLSSRLQRNLSKSKTLQAVGSSPHRSTDDNIDETINAVISNGPQTTISVDQRHSKSKYTTDKEKIKMGQNRPKTSARAKGKNRSLVKIAKKDKKRPNQQKNATKINSKLSNVSLSKAYGSKLSKLNLVLTNVDKIQIDALKAVCQHLSPRKWSLTPKVTPNTSHVVIGGHFNEYFLSGDKPLKWPETTKKTEIMTILLNAIVNGVWIVSSDWIYRSLESERWLPEEEFEISTTWAPAIKQRRLERMAGKSSQLFENCGQIYISPSFKDSGMDLKRFVTKSGGKCTNQFRSADIFVLYELNNNTILRHIRSADSTAIAVSRDWILDSILANRLEPTDDYTFLKAYENLEC